MHFIKNNILIRPGVSCVTNFAALIDLVNRQSAEIANLKQEVAILCQQATTLQQAHPELAASTPASQRVVQPTISKISLHDKLNGIDRKCEVFLINLSLLF